jgi:integration host factor subunit alpha
MVDTGTLTRADLAEMLNRQIGLSRADAAAMVESILDHLTNALLEGDNVKISGFGNFQIREKAPRPGRNPRTGELIPIEARRVATFHASHKLKAVIQGDEKSQD